MTTQSDHQANIRLRRCILEQLYACFQQYPLAAIELRQIEEDCHTSATALNWNIVYLEKKGWVELIHSTDCPPYVACTASLSGAGIDLVENPPAFDAQLPNCEDCEQPKRG